jgi:LTXXQ motif family protein
MKRSTIATTLALAVFASPIWWQAANAQDPHHPGGGTTVQPAMPPDQPGMGGSRGMMGGMPMMNMMRMMGMMRLMGSDMTGMATVDHVEGRIAFLRTELKITEAQASAWNVFADALRTNAQKLGEVRASMMSQHAMGQQQAPTMAERLDSQERWLVARLEGTRTIKSAFTKLYETLSDDQKKTANELLAPHMGMGMMATMPMGGTR